MPPTIETSATSRTIDNQISVIKQLGMAVTISLPLVTQDLVESLEEFCWASFKV